jgi:hypothetical protein
MNDRAFERVRSPCIVMKACHLNVSGRTCHLRVPVRDREGGIRFRERPTVLCEIFNLGRRMYLARFADGITMYLFAHEVEFDDDGQRPPSSEGPH